MEGAKHALHEFPVWTQPCTAIGTGVPQTSLRTEDIDLNFNLAWPFLLFAHRQTPIRLYFLEEEG